MVEADPDRPPALLTVAEAGQELYSVQPWPGPRRRQTTEFARQVLSRVTPEELALRPPLVSWAMGVRKPEPLLRAIEAALVRFRPEAAGSADHALAHPFHGPRPD